MARSRSSIFETLTTDRDLISVKRQPPSFLAVLAISPFKDYRREWKQYKRSYLRFAQARPDTKKLVAGQHFYKNRADIGEPNAVILACPLTSCLAAAQQREALWHPGRGPR
jgi:hypothetical protein